MTHLAIASPGNVSMEELSALVSTGSSGRYLELVDAATHVKAPIAALASAETRIIAQDGAHLVGAAALVHDDYASRLFGDDAAQRAALAAAIDEIHWRLLRACCERMESERWSRLYLHEFDGAVCPTGADSLGFEHPAHGVLLARRTSSSRGPGPVSLPSAALAVARAHPATA